MFVRKDKTSENRWKQRPWMSCCGQGVAQREEAQGGFSHLNAFPEAMLQWFESQTLVPLRITPKRIHWVSPELPKASLATRRLWRSNIPHHPPETAQTLLLHLHLRGWHWSGDCSSLELLLPGNNQNILIIQPLSKGFVLLKWAGDFILFMFICILFYSLNCAVTPGWVMSQF